MVDELGEADAADDEDEERAERDAADEHRRGASAGARAGARDGVAARGLGVDGAGEGALTSPGSRFGGAPLARAALRAAPMPCRSASSSSIARVATSIGSSSRPSASR